MRWKVLATSASMPGVMASRYSTTVTCGAEAGVDRAQLQPDDAGADHDHGFGDLGQRQRAGGGDDGLFVDRDAGEGGGFGPGGDDDVLRRVDLVADLDLTGGGDGAPAFQPGDLVLLEQELDALGVAGRRRRPCRPASWPNRRWALAPIRPIFSKFSWVSCSMWVACSSALEGMQPTFRQVPPSVSRPSTQATFRPSWAARMAQT